MRLARTDLLVLLGAEKLGVSICRAVSRPKDSPYTSEQATDPPDKKLDGIVASTANVSREEAWARQILHGFAYDPQPADAIIHAWEMTDVALEADTILPVTKMDGEDAYLY